ncbi:MULTISPECIES: FxsA family protein [Thalassolituus]|uniref:FxsA family protein n=2 Tax=Oceanospirillaceae TaxID=135620 RepID=UPI002647EBD3|nr:MULTISPECIES: FxsA family protein [Thalassolituus]MED5439883.1 FxsA family protein [Pseudomonadota bacterium]MEE3161072.1 FxsA family protein [Pseudomonadota bacterium]
MPLLFIFILVPMAELAVLIKVGSAIGILWTFALILLTALVGVTLLRAQGLATLMRASERMRQGSLPAQELAEGFLLALAGALLLTPGFITDAFGFSLLLPGVRGVMAQSIMKRFKPQVMNPFEQPGTQEPFNQRQQSQRPQRDGRVGGDVIEGDYKRED